MINAHRYILILVIIGVAFLKLATAGWFTITLGLALYPTVLVLHGFAHWSKRNSFEGHESKKVALICLSHALFVTAFLFQFDMGDDFGWYSGALLWSGWWPHLGPGTNIWHEGIMFLLNFCVMIPAMISYSFMGTTTGKRVAMVGTFLLCSSIVTLWLIKVL